MAHWWAERTKQERRITNVYHAEPDGATAPYVKESDVNAEIKRLEESIANPNTQIEILVDYSETTNQLTQAGAPVTTEELLERAKKQLEEYRDDYRASIAQLQAGLEKRRAKQKKQAADDAKKE
jgi:hypothetical protein